MSERRREFITLLSRAAMAGPLAARAAGGDAVGWYGPVIKPRRQGQAVMAARLGEFRVATVPKFIGEPNDQHLRRNR